MAKGGRRAKARAQADAPKRAKTTVAATSTQSEHPLFCFRYVDRSSQHEWRFDPGSDATRIIGFLQDMAALSWGQIEGQITGGKNRHKKHHGQPIDQIEPPAQEDIRRLKLDETFGDEMFRFRLQGEQRLWGYRVGRIFHVIWWDPRHKVRPSAKKNT